MMELHCTSTTSNPEADLYTNCFMNNWKGFYVAGRLKDETYLGFVLSLVA